MRPTRRLCTILSAAVLALAGVVVALPGWADAPLLTVTIVSPTDGSTVSGKAVDVRYTVTSAPGQTVEWVGVRFAGTYQDVYVGGACESGCTRTATFDTTGVPLAPTAQDAGDYADGPQTITVRATSTSTSVGGDVTTTAPVVVDNHRPADGLAPPQPDPQTSIWAYTATDRLNIHAYPTANDGGAVAGMTFHYLSNGVRSTEPLTPPAASGGAWTLEMDTSAWPSDDGSGWVSTTDDRGISSIGTMVYYVVDRGMALTGPTLSGTVDDITADDIQLQYSYASPNPKVYPAKVTTYIDGTAFDERMISPPGSYSSDPPGVITPRTGSRTPSGEHDVRFVVTDNRGIGAEVDYHLTIRATLALSWATDLTRGVMPGRVTLGGTADSTGTTLRSSTFFVDDRPLDGWGCYVGDCPTHLDATGTGQPYPEAYTPGRHSVRWEVSTKDGLPLVLAGTITVLPYAVTTPLTRGPATYGHALVLMGHAMLTDGRPAPGAAVTLQRQPPEASADPSWTSIATATADGAGDVTFNVPAGERSSYRMVTSDEPAAWAGRSGPAVTVDSYADLQATSRPTTSRLGRTVRVRGLVRPAPQGTIWLQEYRHHHWSTRASATPGADGRFAFRYRLQRERVRLRLLRPSSAGLLTTATPAWRIRAR